MAALKNILGVQIIDMMRKKDIRKALNQTEIIVQKVHEQQHLLLPFALSVFFKKLFFGCFEGF